MTIDITTANRVPLPGGAWADLRPVQDIRERARRPIKKLSGALFANTAFSAVILELQASGRDPEKLTEAEQMELSTKMGTTAFDELEVVQDLLIVAAVRGWSFRDENDVPVPVTADGVLDLPGTALDDLRRFVAPYQKALQGRLAEPTPDPESPTVPSSD